jgi:hypothetical protein
MIFITLLLLYIGAPLLVIARGGLGDVRMHICGIDIWSFGLTWMKIVQALIL